MKRLCAASRNLTPFLAAFSIALSLASYASADTFTLVDPIIAVKDATGPCSSNGLTNGGGTICAGNTTAFSLTALENGTQQLQAVVGTQTSPVYLVNNDTGKTTFSLLLTGSIAFNQFVDCQESGGFSGKGCTVSGSLGTVGNSAQYGPPSGLSNGTYWNPNALFTFTLLSTTGNFDISFSSFGNGDHATLSAAPLPGALPLFGTAIIGAMTLLGWRKRRNASSF